MNQRRSWVARWQMWLAMLVLMVTTQAIATPFVTLTQTPAPTDGIQEIYVGNDLSTQVKHTIDASDWQVYPSKTRPGDFGTLLVVDGQLYAPDFNASGRGTATGTLGPRTAFVPVGQTAVQDIIFWSSNEIIARWLVLKNDKNGNSAVCRASYNDGEKIKSMPNYNFGFKSSHLNTQNPFSASRGSMDFLKEGAKLQFYYSGRYYAVNVPALADKKVTKVSIVLANYDKRTGNNYVTHNAIQKLQIRKLKVDKWRDVPNRYSTGDVVKLTGADSKVRVNDMPKLTEKVDGSNLFTIPPGETTIYFQCSDWCTTPPTYQIEFTEANL